jgi:catechol 2,3-dioxygenase-like lactoylglutathione lyase family enzyme
MTRTTGFDHVATVTADLDRIVAFYQHVFDARVTFEMAATPAHPRMAILDLGGGSALKIACPSVLAGQVQCTCSRDHTPRGKPTTPSR